MKQGFIKTKVMLSIMIFCSVLCLYSFALLSTVSAAPISEQWLSDQVKNLPTQKTTEHAIYVKPLGLGQDNHDVVLNSHKMASASLIKIPIMIEAYNQKNQGLLDFNEKITIRHTNTVEGGSIYNLPDGTTLTIGQIVELMIVQSDNTAANILIDKLSMKKVNAMIDSLGCKDTLLQRKMMDFEAAKQGRQNYTSVTDMANLLEKLYKLQCLDPASDQAMLDTLARQEDNTAIPAQLPHHITIAHKTGELDGMNYDCAIVYGQSHDYILCIMAENVKDEPHAFYDMSAISLAIYDQIGR
jgi:beta-lactamase class A